MKRARSLLIGAASAVALAALPINLAPTAFGDLDPAAHAKNGGGNGGGHGGGKSGDSGRGSSGQHGKSAEARGHNNSARGGVAVARSAGNAAGAVKELSRGKGWAKKEVAMKFTNKAARFASLPAAAPLPEAKPKNFNAKLAGLNSLKRNYHAYLNSQSPRMAAISAFVKASAEFDLARERVGQAELALAEAGADFVDAVDAAAPVPYDGAVGVYDNPTVDSLTSRLNDLNNAVVADEDLAAWNAEVAALEGLLESTEASAVAEAETSLDEAELAADAATVGTDDEALKAALLEAANRNRVAQYGEDYVNDEMLDWAKSLLGVGDAVGTIDQVRATLND